MDRILSPFRIQKFLAGLHYPARKPQILARARALSADETVMQALHGIPERTYDSPIVLACEVSRVRAPGS